MKHQRPPFHTSPTSGTSWRQRLRDMRVVVLVGGGASAATIAAMIGLPSAAVSTGCTSTCSPCVALDSFAINLASGDGGNEALPDGDYHFTIDADGDVFELEATIEGGVGSCPDGCTEGDVESLGASLDLDPAGPRLIVHGTPVVITVEVAMDGGPVEQATFEPTYVEGEAICCGDGARTAVDEMTIGADE
jgi:hypothetical protein